MPISLVGGVVKPTDGAAPFFACRPIVLATLQLHRRNKTRLLEVQPRCSRIASEVVVKVVELVRDGYGGVLVDRSFKLLRERRPLM